jgi:hypothetical protein
MKCIKLVFILSLFLVYSPSLASKEKTVQKEGVMHSIEEALLKRDCATIRSLMADESAEKNIYKKLSYFLREIHPDNHSKLETLLKAGVKPKGDPYYEAINQEDVQICSLLHRFGINPSKSDKAIFRAKFTFEDMIRQTPPTFVQKLSEITLTQTRHREIDQEIDAMYHNIALRLQAAKNESQRNGRPMLILVGEEHRSFNSFLNEIIILHLAKEYHIETLYTEAFSVKSYERMDWRWRPSMGIEKVANQLNIRKKPIDLFACNHYLAEDKLEECVNVPRTQFAEGYSWTSPQGVEDRNKIMANELISSGKDKDKLVIVGAGHMFGLNKLLASDFHVHAISVAHLPHILTKPSSQYEKEAVEYASSVAVPFIKSIHNPALFLSIDVYVDKAKEGYKRFKNLNPQKT